MKLYKYTFGDWERYGAAKDDADAFERRMDIDPQFHYVPVVIEEVTIEGYTISVTKDEPKTGTADPSHIVHTSDRDGLKQWLNEHGIEFTPQWGEAKLRELALQNI